MHSFTSVRLYFALTNCFLWQIFIWPINWPLSSDVLRKEERTIGHLLWITCVRFSFFSFLWQIFLWPINYEQSRWSFTLNYVGKIFLSFLNTSDDGGGAEIVYLRCERVSLCRRVGGVKVFVTAKLSGSVREFLYNVF